MKNQQKCPTRNKNSGEGISGAPQWCRIFQVWSLCQMESSSNFSENTIHGFLSSQKFGTCYSRTVKRSCLINLPLAKLVLSLSLLNSAVERIFSTLITLLSNHRLRLNHETMGDCLLIAGNNAQTTESNKEKILDSAVLQYFEKWCTMKITVAPPASP